MSALGAERRTRAIVARSPRWTEAVKGLSITAIGEGKPLDMSGWDGATHEAARAWASGERDIMPPVLAEYLAALLGAS